MGTPLSVQQFSATEALLLQVRVPKITCEFLRTAVVTVGSHVGRSDADRTHTQLPPCEVRTTSTRHIIGTFHCRVAILRARGGGLKKAAQRGDDASSTNRTHGVCQHGRKAALV